MQSERKNKCSGTLDTPLAEDVNWRKVEHLLDEAETRSAEREEDFGRRYLNILFSSNWTVREKTRPKIEKMTPQETRAYVRAKRLAMEQREEERKREQHKKSLPRIPSPRYLHRHPPRDERREMRVKKMLGEMSPPPTPSVKGLSYSVEEASWVEDVESEEEEEQTGEPSLASINRFLEDMGEEASQMKSSQSREQGQTSDSSRYLAHTDLADAHFPWLVVDESKEDQSKGPEPCISPVPVCGLVSSEEVPGIPSLPKQSWQPGSGSEDMLEELAQSLPLDLPTDWDDDTEDDYATPC